LIDFMRKESHSSLNHRLTAFISVIAVVIMILAPLIEEMPWPSFN